MIYDSINESSKRVSMMWREYLPGPAFTSPLVVRRALGRRRRRRCCRCVRVLFKCLQLFGLRISGLLLEILHFRRFGFGCAARRSLGAVCRRYFRHRRLVGALHLQPRNFLFQFGDACLGFIGAAPLGLLPGGSLRTSTRPRSEHDSPA